MRPKLPPVLRFPWAASLFAAALAFTISCALSHGRAWGLAYGYAFLAGVCGRGACWLANRSAAPSSMFAALITWASFTLTLLFIGGVTALFSPPRDLRHVVIALLSLPATMILLAIMISIVALPASLIGVFLFELPFKALDLARRRSGRSV